MVQIQNPLVLPQHSLQSWLLDHLHSNEEQISVRDPTFDTVSFQVSCLRLVTDGSTTDPPLSPPPPPQDSLLSKSRVRESLVLSLFLFMEQNPKSCSKINPPSARQFINLPTHFINLGLLNSKPRAPNRTLELGLVGVWTRKPSMIHKLEAKYHFSNP